MNKFSEYFICTKGLDQVPPSKREAFQNRLMKIFNVTTKASLSRRVNGINKTPYTQQVKAGNEFLKLGITNYKGRTRKRNKSESRECQLSMK